MKNLMIFTFSTLLALYLGLEAGFRIGIHHEAATHRAYIESLNLGGK